MSDIDKQVEINALVLSGEWCNDTTDEYFFFGVVLAKLDLL